MLFDLYTFDHNVLHVCFWLIPSILVGVAMIVMAVIHNQNQKKREKEFEQEMAEKMASPAEPADAVHT